MLAYAQERRDELAQEQAGQDTQGVPGNLGAANAGSQPFGGGKRVEFRSFENLSAKTGKSPEQLIAEHSE